MLIVLVAYDYAFDIGVQEGDAWSIEAWGIEFVSVSFLEVEDICSYDVIFEIGVV